ncbi:MAG: diacylglycerol kinase family lipid kinase [bacterium]|jgi:diacylglycerol kinase (ATP)
MRNFRDGARKKPPCPFPAKAKDLDVLIFIKPAQLPLKPEIEKHARKVFHRANTVCPEDLDQLEKTASRAAGSFNLIMAAGGDGTLNRIVNALDTAKCGIAVIALGSGNDFARNFHNPGQLRDKLTMFEGAEWRAVDLCKAGPYYYINSGGIGLDAATLATREKSRGKFLRDYNIAFLRTLPRLSALECRASLDGADVSGRYLWALAMNNREIGGGMLAAPDARIDDGLFDVLLVGDIPKIRLGVLLPLIHKGTHVRHPAVKYVQGKSLSIELPGAIKHLALDGELYFTSESKIEFRVLPGAAWVFGAFVR